MSQHWKGQPWDKTYCDDDERAARDPARLHDPEGHKTASPRLLGDLIVHLQAIEERQERMEQMLKLIVKTIAEGAGEDEVEEGGHEREDSSAFEKEDNESGRESDGEDKGPPATPPASCPRRADPHVTASSPAMNTHCHSRSQASQLTCIAEYSPLERFKHFHLSTGYVLNTTVRGH
jgi:hypothetical protein